MRITDLLKSESIMLGAQPKDKNDAIAILTGLMEKGGNLSDKAQYEKDVLAREASGTTGLGDGIATPHAKSAGVKEPGLAAMTVPAGMDFEAMDGKPSRLFFEIAAPDTAADVHLEVLSKLATMIMDPDFKEALVAAKSKEEFLSLIDAKEDGKFEAAKDSAPVAAEADAKEAAPETSAAPAKITKKILAVTACPTGIAHTFMAAESLEQHAKKRGIPFKAETNGSGGAKNILTAEEIRDAACIIVASLLRTSRCTSAAVSGAAISKKRREGLPSIASKSMPAGTVIAASPGSLTPALLACGVAMPSPSPVVPEASRASTSFSYCALSERLPPFSISPVKMAMASSLSFGCAPSAMLSLFNKSVIRISTVPFFQPAFSRWSLKAPRLRGAVRGFRKMPTQSLSRRP